MTQNKFWLVWSPQGLTPPKKRYETQEKAIAGAKKLAESYPKQDIFVVEATHHFKANVNVIETDLTAPENDFVELAEQVKYEFKIGDNVLYQEGIYESGTYWRNGVVIDIINNIWGKKCVKVKGKDYQEIFNYLLDCPMVKPAE